MNRITSIILSLLMLLLGTTQTSTAKNSLHKKPTTEDQMKALNGWIQKYFYIICLAVLIAVFLTFILTCFYACGLSATESGMMRNFINGGVL